MKRKYYNRGRDKAFIGAAISAVGGIVGGIFGAKKAKKQAKAQAEAARINAQNQQNSINAQYQSQQNAIDNQYEQNVLNVRAQEEYNREQNAAAAKKTGIENAAGLTNMFANQNALNTEFRNRFMACGGKRKTKKCGGSAKGLPRRGRAKAALGTGEDGAWTAGDTGSLISGIGSGVSSMISAFTPTYTPTAYKMNYKVNTYKTYDPAKLEVYDGVTDTFTGRKVGEGSNKYNSAINTNINTMNTIGQNPAAAVTAGVNSQFQPRYRAGGYRKLIKRRS